MDSKVIAVLAVHNEQDMLPYTFKQLESQVDEIVAVLDDCSDRSEAIINSSRKTWIVKVYDGCRYSGCRWRNYRAETKGAGLKLVKDAFGECNILMVDCDVLLDGDSVRRAKRLLESSGKDAVVFVYKQYSLNGSVFSRVKDEVLNLFGRFTKKLTKQPVVGGLYLIRSKHAAMGDVASDYETVISKLNVAWLNTGIKHLRPRYDGYTQKLMGTCRATLHSYNLSKILLYAVLTFSPLVASGFLTAKLRGTKTVEDGFY